MRAQVERLIGSELAAVEAHDFAASIEPAGRQWLLRLRTLPKPAGPERLREIYGATCAELVGAAAVAIAMTITGAQPAPRDAAARPRSQQQGAPPVSAPVQPPIAANSVADASPLRYSVALGLALDLGLLPALAPGAQLELALRWPSAQVVLLGALFASQRELISGSDRGGEFALALVGLLGCARRELSAVLHGVGCGGFELGQLAAAGVGPGVRATDHAQLVYGPRAELGLQWQVSSGLGFFARIGAAVPLARDDFRLGQSVVHKPSSASFRSQLGFEFTL